MWCWQAGPATVARRAALKNAVARLDEIEATTTRPPSILFRERGRYRAALGDASGAIDDQKRADAQPPISSHDWTMLGSFLFVNGDLAAAEQALREAVARDVTSFWAWFNLGHCHFEEGRFLEAVSDFTACVVARPEFAWAHFNRGLALARAGRPREAKDAFNSALVRDGDFAEAYVDRGLVELELDQPVEAEADLLKGMARGRRDPAVLGGPGRCAGPSGEDERGRPTVQRLDRSDAGRPDPPGRPGDHTAADRPGLGRRRLPRGPRRASPPRPRALRACLRRPRDRPAVGPGASRSGDLVRSQPDRRLRDAGAGASRGHDRGRSTTSTDWSSRPRPIACTTRPAPLDSRRGERRAPVPRSRRHASQGLVQGRVPHLPRGRRPRSGAAS